MAKRKQEADPKRYHVEYLDWDKGRAMMAEGCKKSGDDPERASLWDYCDQGEITVCHACPTKEAAFAWAKENAKLDVFNMPRICEQTQVVRRTDDRGRPVRACIVWERTGYWEVDGDDIFEAEAAA